jgi:pyrophosphatase PpaX
MQKIEAVIWDVDGTLISTKKLYPEAYRRALAPYVGRDLTDAELFKIASHSELRFLQRHAGEHYAASLKDFQRHYAELHASHFGGIYDGVLETLAELRRRGIRMGIVTGKSRSSYEASVAYADIGPFDVLVMDDDVDQPKPHPQGILAALNELSVVAAAAIYVGDSITDLEAAEAAGAIAAAALWSKEGKYRIDFDARLAAHPQAYRLNQPHDLLDLIPQS